MVSQRNNVVVSVRGGGGRVSDEGLGIVYALLVVGHKSKKAKIINLSNHL